MKNGNSRRQFLAKLTCIGLASQLKINQLNQLDKTSIDWEVIGDQFLAKKSKTINLNNGSASNMPIPVLEEHIKFTREVNSFAPYDVYIKWLPQIKANHVKLQKLIGSQQGSHFLVKNTTEAINLILWGKKFRKKDEILCSRSDYPYVHNTLLQLSKQKQVRIKSVDCKLPHTTDAEIVELYERKITPKTKLLILTYITHREGHIFPVKAICKMAKKHGVEVLLDAAHAVGQIDHKISEIGCEYYASSLHKWLNAPLGSGLLYIQKDKLKKLQPHLSFPINKEDDPVKFEYLGTRAFQNYMTLGSALDFLELTGIEAKQKRLNHLKNYWVNQLEGDSRFTIATDPKRSCCIASFRFTKNTYSITKKILRKEYDIHVKTSSYPGKSLFRISPNIYTAENDLDEFIKAIKKEA